MMTQDQKRALLETLETLVDRHGLANVLDCLAEVCSDKAEHLRANWQDDRAAKRWVRAGLATLRAHTRAMEGGL